MNGREYFHESVVKDIVDILTDLKDFDEVQFINNANAKRSFKSITSATKDLILTFPVMVSTDIEPDNAIMIAKAQEKKMASLLHILFTAISVGSNEDVYDYVRKFHANVGSMNGTLDGYADAFDKLATTFGESYDATLKIDHEVLNTVLEELKESNYTLPDNVNESSLESYKIVPGYRTGYNDMIIQEDIRTIYKGNGKKRTPIGYSFGSRADAAGVVALQTRLHGSDRSKWSNIGIQADEYLKNSDVPVQGRVDRQIHSGTTINQNESDREAAARDSDTIYDFEHMSQQEIDDAKANGTYDNMKKEYEKALARKAQRDKPNETIQRRIDQGPKGKDMSPIDMAKYMESITKAHNAIVLNNEYKKANELQPTMMVVNFMKKDKNDEGYINTAVIGIKCKIYPVTSADIVNRISGKLQDKSFLTNFVRATTNEIAFFRDFLFAVDQAKFDAKSYGKNASSNKLWKVLERRSTKSKFRRSLKMYNDATAISTLVMSENDSEYLKKVHSIDILDVSKARKIMDSYNFMCLVVANQSTEVASFLYDTGDDTYEMIPFSGLEREASDNSYKKMVNLLSKVSR